MEIWIHFCWWNISSTGSHCSVNYGLFPEWPRSLGLKCCVTSGLDLFIVAAFYFDFSRQLSSDVYLIYRWILYVFFFLVCVANTSVQGCLCTWLGVWDGRLCTLGNFIGRNTLGSSPKMLARRLEPPAGSIYMYYGVSYHMFSFLFERTFLVIHCKTHLWSLLLTLIGSWTAPSLRSRYSISLRYISYFIFLLLCFSLVVVFGACY